MDNSKRHKNPVGDWANTILAELRGPEIPHDAVCEADLVSRGIPQSSAGVFLRKKVASGEFVRARGK